MGKPPFPLYDVCVIELIKSRTYQSLDNFLKAAEPDTYLCLGHFDIMKAMRTCGNSFPLEKIQAHAQSSTMLSSKDLSSETCCYPLYMLKQLTVSDDRTQDELDQFWAMDCNFFCVIRFHCDWTEEAKSNRQFSDILLTRSRTLPDPNKISPENYPVSRLQVNSKIQSCTFYLEHIPDLSQEAVETETQETHKLVRTAGAVAFYDSLELGDVVGIVKSNSLCTAMDILQHLYGCEVVSNAYTYCGVDCKLFLKNADLQLPPEQTAPLVARSLTCTTTRFCVKLAQEAHHILNELQPIARLVGFVTGTADIIVEWPPCTEENFLSYIKKVVSFPTLYDAFSDIITRIGIPYTTPWDSREMNPNKSNSLDNFPNIKDLSWLSCDQLKRWRYPIRRLVSTLQSMYESSMLDALAHLLIPGVNAFLARMRYIQENNLWDNTYEQDVTDFLDHWATLANDISHLETQIVQHPDLTPARYYIPAMVLRFERTLLQECVSVVESLDKVANSDSENKPRKFAPILLPTSEDSVYTQCPLDPEFDIKYTDPSPLCIFLPIHRIYHPWELAHMLCHEIQHYSGDTLRCRELRLECITNSAAAYLMTFLRLYLLKPGSYHSNHLKEEQDFQEKITSLIIQQLKGQDTPPYLNVLERNLPDTMFNIIKINDIQEELQRIVCDGMTASEYIDNIHWICQMNVMESGVVLHNYFDKHIHYLCGLYKECYADVAMILILHCSFQDYFRCIFGREQKKYPNLPENHEDQEMMERHTDRLAMVILAVGTVWTKWCSEQDVTVPWSIVAWEKVKYWRSNCNQKSQKSYMWKRYYLPEEISSYCLIADEALQLERYLARCAERLVGYLFVKQESVKDLRTHLEYVSKSCFDWNSARNYLEHQLSSNRPQDAD